MSDEIHEDDFNFDVRESDRVEVYRQIWEFTQKHEKLNKDQLGEFLKREDFSSRIIEALTRSFQPDSTDNQDYKLQEWGLIAYRHSFSPRDPKVYLSPLIEGRESNIVMSEYNFPRDSQDPNPRELPKSILRFHTHPTPTNILTQKSTLHEIFGEHTRKQSCYFSKRDLRTFQNLSRNRPDLINAVGQLDTDNRKTGEVLLVSFGNFGTWYNFDYTKLWSNTDIALLFNEDPRKVYKKSGLNVASIKVDLEKGLNPLDIQKAAVILSKTDLP